MRQETYYGSEQSFTPLARRTYYGSEQSFTPLIGGGGEAIRTHLGPRSVAICGVERREDWRRRLRRLCSAGPSEGVDLDLLRGIDLAPGDQADVLHWSDAQKGDQADVLHRSDAQKGDQADVLRRSDAQEGVDLYLLRSAGAQESDQADVLHWPDAQKGDQADVLHSAGPSRPSGVGGIQRADPEADLSHPGQSPACLEALASPSRRGSGWPPSRCGAANKGS